MSESMKELKQRLLDELLRKEKEVKQLHLQHLLEKSQIEEVAHRQRRQFVKDKESMKKDY